MKAFGYALFFAALFTSTAAAAPVVPGLANKHPLTEPQVGQLLIGELRCTACHTSTTAPLERAAPDLADVGARVAPEYMRKFLASPSAAHAVPVEVRLYDRLFSVENPESAPEGKTFLDYLNPGSLEVLAGARAEPSLASAAAGTRVQFERLGYFCVDPDSTPGALVFNRTVSLRDAWVKIQKG